MAYYLIQVAYTAETLETLLAKPQDRTAAIRPAIEKLGGKLESTWFSFGEYDVVVIVQMPDNASAAAFSFAVSAGGALKAVKTTPLMTIEEGVAAMKKAAGSGYCPPGG